MSNEFFAHSLPGQPLEKWQLLEDHLKNVRNISSKFASHFEAEKWAELEGFHHDLGKGTKQWQAFLRKENNIIDDLAALYEGHPNHAAVGAQWLYQHNQEAGKLLAYCIAGHHGGLPNWYDSATRALEGKLQQPIPELSVPLSTPEFPSSLPFSLDSNRMGFQIQFFVRNVMMDFRRYSCQLIVKSVVHFI